LEAVRRNIPLPETFKAHRLVFKAHRLVYHSTLGSRVGEDNLLELPFEAVRRNMPLPETSRIEGSRTF